MRLSALYSQKLKVPRHLSAIQYKTKVSGSDVFRVKRFLKNVEAMQWEA